MSLLCTKDKTFGSHRQNEILQIENKARSPGKVCSRKAPWEDSLCKIKKNTCKKNITPYVQN